MARKSKLTQELIERIVELRKLELNDTQICRAIGISRMTLWRWRLQGSKQKNGLAKTLIDAEHAVDLEIYTRYVSAVHNEALEGKTTSTKKHTKHPDGRVTEEEVTRTDAPNGTLALKLLQTHYPNQWVSPNKNQRSWEECLLEQGHDPEEIEALIEAYLEKSLSTDT